MKFPQQNISQSETRLCDKKLSVELYVTVKTKYVVIMFEFKMSNLHCNWINLISVLSFANE